MNKKVVGVIKHTHELILSLGLKKNSALAGVAQWIECQSVNQRGVAGSIPSQGTCLGCGPGPQ